MSKNKKKLIKFFSKIKSNNLINFGLFLNGRFNYFSKNEIINLANYFAKIKKIKAKKLDDFNYLLKIKN